MFTDVPDFLDNKTNDMTDTLMHPAHRAGVPESLPALSLPRPLLVG